MSVLNGTIEQMATLLKEHESLLQDKDVLAEELQHRVRNNLQLVFGMLNRQIEISSDGGKEGIRAIAVRVMSLAAIYDHLLGNGLSRTIDFDRYLRSPFLPFKNSRAKRGMRAPREGLPLGPYATTFLALAGAGSDHV